MQLLMSERAQFITGADFLIDGGAAAPHFYGPLRPEQKDERMDWNEKKFWSKTVGLSTARAACRDL